VRGLLNVCGFFPKQLALILQFTTFSQNPYIRPDGTHTGLQGLGNRIAKAIERRIEQCDLDPTYCHFDNRTRLCVCERGHFPTRKPHPRPLVAVWIPAIPVVEQVSSFVHVRNKPTDIPTHKPTAAPTEAPTVAPTDAPIVSNETNSYAPSNVTGPEAANDPDQLFQLAALRVASEGYVVGDVAYILTAILNFLVWWKYRKEDWQAYHDAIEQQAAGAFMRRASAELGLLKSNVK
jgi:hypothetical protein